MCWFEVLKHINFIYREERSNECLSVVFEESNTQEILDTEDILTIDYDY